MACPTMAKGNLCWGALLEVVSLSKLITTTLAIAVREWYNFLCNLDPFGATLQTTLVKCVLKASLLEKDFSPSSLMHFEGPTVRCVRQTVCLFSGGHRPGVNVGIDRTVRLVGTIKTSDTGRCPVCRPSVRSS